MCNRVLCITLGVIDITQQHPSSLSLTPRKGGSQCRRGSPTAATGPAAERAAAGGESGKEMHLVVLCGVLE